MTPPDPWILSSMNNACRVQQDHMDHMIRVLPRRYYHSWRFRSMVDLCMETIDLFIVNVTRWYHFKLNDGNYLPHEYRLHCLLECHMFRVMLTAMTSGRGRHGQFFCSGPRAGASAENVSPPTTGLQNGQQWSGVFVGKQYFFHSFSERAFQVL